MIDAGTGWQEEQCKQEFWQEARIGIRGRVEAGRQEAVSEPELPAAAPPSVCGPHRPPPRFEIILYRPSAVPGREAGVHPPAGCEALSATTAATTTTMSYYVILLVLCQTAHTSVYSNMTMTTSSAQVLPQTT